MDMNKRTVMDYRPGRARWCAVEVFIASMDELGRPRGATDKGTNKCEWSGPCELWAKAGFWKRGVKAPAC